MKAASLDSFIALCAAPACVARRASMCPFLCVGSIDVEQRLAL